jgi:hypothetical protein
VTPAGRAEAGARRVRARERRTPVVRDIVVAGVHLAVLWAFAVAQPLFDLLGRNAEFFAARGSSASDIVAFALGVILVPPACLLLVELAAGLLHPYLGRALHLLFVTALAAAIALQGLKRVADASATVLIVAAAVAGLVVAVAVARVRLVRSLVSVLAPAPLVFVCLFLFFSPVAKLVRPGESQTATAAVSARAPVVMVVFDEFPVTSLMNERRQVDASRFPNFAALARGSTWFRNATSVTGQTTDAVPAMLTGNHPDEEKLPVFSDHPRNLFTLLGGSYRLNVSEVATRLCPKDLCEADEDPVGERIGFLLSDVSVVYLHLLFPDDLAEELPSVSEGWMDFRGDDRGEPDERERMRADAARNPDRKRGVAKDRDLQFESFVERLSPTRRPTLHFLHILLPHRPWEYLPSGTVYGYKNARVSHTPRGYWVGDEVLVAQEYQRYVVQLGFVDRLLGSLLRRLRATGLYDRALVVVTADHGVSFEPGGASRALYPSNLHEIGPVPLFVKTPGQRSGRVVERNLQTIDILPTIARALGVRIPWPIEGRPAFGPAAVDRQTLTLERKFVIRSRTIERRKYADLARKLETFPAGNGWADVFRVGPHAELVGRRVDALPVVASAGLVAEVDEDEARWLRDVDPASGFVPAYVTGRIEGEGGGGVDLAVAVNGRIAAVTRSSPHETPLFAALVPESAFRPGSNAVEIFAVSSGSGALRLERLGGVGPGAEPG